MLSYKLNYLSRCSKDLQKNTYGHVYEIYLGVVSKSVMVVALLGDGGSSGSPKKKHKKNKHKKHHYVVADDLEGSASPTGSSSFQRPITLKIKLGDRLISSSTTG